MTNTSVHKNITVTGIKRAPEQSTSETYQQPINPVSAEPFFHVNEHSSVILESLNDP